MEGIKMKSYELNPICNSTADCIYCGNKQTCEKVVYPYMLWGSETTMGIM